MYMFRVLKRENGERRETETEYREANTKTERKYMSCVRVH